ncbi:peptidase M61 domain protein, partial [mine drainage metagenome]
ANRVDFDVVPLNMLVDSPLDCGRYYKKYTLWQQGAVYQRLDVFADRPQDLDIPASLIAKYKRMTPEALALYGSRHWNNYHSLLVLSNRIGFEGIEHHQSSDDRAPDTFMTNPKWQLVAGDLLTHEFSHSWNGKYRRPWDLTTLNFQIPQRTDLLWVYEGMNQYLGDLLSFRMGIRKPDQYPQYLATLYSQMANEPGRLTEPLIDLTTAAPYLYEARGSYPEIRRTAGDFYAEGELLWLDVDTIIRAKTHGEKSLDDFLHLYSEPALTGPITKTYTRADIEKLLNEVVPYDWHAFFQKHVYDVARLPPTGELRRSGWKLVYTSTPNPFMTAQEALRHVNDQWLTYGLKIGKKGKVSDVREYSPAWKAGMAPGMVIKAVDGQAYSPNILAYAMKQAEHDTAATVFVVDNNGWYQHYAVAYHGGPRYPHLVRIPGVPNMLARIMAPHAHS